MIASTIEIFCLIGYDTEVSSISAPVFILYSLQSIHRKEPIMKNSHYDPRKQRFKETFEESSANYSDVDNQKPENNAQGRPIQLIKIRPTGKIEVNEEALQIIASYNQPVGFVSLVGKTRTGKSCLMNRLLNIKGQGFRVEASTSSCTQGIWMWSIPYQNPKYNNLIFFIDTQGTDSLVKDPENDTKIFTLAVLISTYFIYNSIGSIDERSISEIEMVTALSKKIKTGEDGEYSDSAQLSRFMPKFLWLLRDFMLKIQDKNGKRITPNAYLQNSLRDQNSIGKVDETSRKIKKSILTYFPIRECLTLVRPVDEEELLYDLNSLDDHKIRRQFIDGVKALRDKIIDNTGPKIYGGKDITGYGMSVMIQNYVQAFNSGSVPNIKSAWEQIAADQGNEAYNKAIQVYQTLLHTQLGDQKPHGEQIYRIVGKLRSQTMAKFTQQAGVNLKQHKQQQKKLQQLINRNQAQILQQNDKYCLKHNNGIIYSQSQKLKSRIESNFYSNADGKAQLSNDIEEIKENYMKESIGKNSGQVLAEFMAAITPMLMNIKTGDQYAQAEAARQQQIAQEEHKQQMKLIQQKNESMQKQLQAKDRGDTIKTGSKMPRKQTSKEKKETQGCCSGKCCIM